MKIYLAAGYQRLTEIAGYACQLEELGHDITSSWLAGDDGLTFESPVQVLFDTAKKDLADVSIADALILFTLEDPLRAVTGGCFVEYGFAMGHGIPVFLVGRKANIFCWLANHFGTWEECLEYFKEENP